MSRKEVSQGAVGIPYGSACACLHRPPEHPGKAVGFEARVVRIPPLILTLIYKGGSPNEAEVCTLAYPGCRRSTTISAAIATNDQRGYGSLAGSGLSSKGVCGSLPG